jgi:heme/copper-type cytochrome/quinol oxidase subunit 3
VTRLSIDASQFPDNAFGSRTVTWWGTLGILLIEGSVFALAIVTYFYLRSRVPTWPPNVPPPALLYGTINTLILLVSLWPNEMAKRSSEHEDLAKTRLWLVVSQVFTIAFLVVRVFEFATLNCRWYTNAYGSAVWSLLGFHTAHLLTEAVETAVILVLFFVGPIQKKRFTDVEDNSFYWYFVVGAWIPVYLVIYWAPRWLS